MLIRGGKKYIIMLDKIISIRGMATVYRSTPRKTDRQKGRPIKKKKDKQSGGDGQRDKVRVTKGNEEREFATREERRRRRLRVGEWDCKKLGKERTK